MITEGIHGTLARIQPAKKYKRTREEDFHQFGIDN
jgi:hypothetical protein